MRDAVLLSVSSEGHAVRGASSESAACALVSITLKSLGMTLAGRAGCHVQVAAPVEGSFRLRVIDCSEPEWLAGVWDVSRTALQEAVAVWANEIELRIEEAEHGS